jgi:pimeloyl-ACP methyl ester carboxylesterase
MSDREIFYTSQDGLRLFARDYGDRASMKTPVLCLPGLTRNSKDFDQIAVHLAHERRVICADFRGRGRSQYCENPSDYTPFHEMQDTLDLMAAAGVAQAVFIGTSRGGIVTMLLGAHRPNAIRGAILNDIGPELEMAGLKRIAGYVGIGDAPANWDEAAIRVRMMNEREFPTVSGAEWRAYSKRTFAEENGAPKVDYDVRIGQVMRKSMESGAAAPTLWPQWKALGHVPALVIRGENSDLLSAETLQRMGEEYPRLRALTVKDRGHAPFLDEAEAVAAIDAFLAENGL